MIFKTISPELSFPSLMLELLPNLALCSAVMNLPSWLSSEKHRRLVQRWWIVIVVIWDISKTFVIDKTLSRYGVNPYIYFTITISISIPYALVTARMLFAFIERHWKNSLIYGFAAAIFHFIPDAYIFLSAKEVPRTLFDGMIAIVILFTVFTVRGIIIHVRTQHAKRDK